MDSILTDEEHQIAGAPHCFWDWYGRLWLQVKKNALLGVSDHLQTIIGTARQLLVRPGRTWPYRMRELREDPYSSIQIRAMHYMPYNMQMQIDLAARR